MAEPRLALPTYTTTFVGRRDEINAIATLLRDPVIRLITLLGRSGTGKSRLSREVGVLAAADFPRGVYFVALAAVSDPALVLPTIAETFDVQEQGDQPLIETLIASLQGQSTLLILDNFEQVREAARDLTALLEGVSGLKILVTSQMRLEAPHEHVYPIPPLAMPPLDEPYSIDDLLQFPAIALFVDRLTATQPHFQLTGENVGAVRELCARVAGLPLAIELVAAHSWGLTPAQVLQLLSVHFVLRPLNGSETSNSDRILTPLLDWCFAMLEPDLRVFFTRTGIFVGGCTLDALAPICDPKHNLQIDVVSAMQTLTQRHLVLEEAQEGQDLRYVMLDAVRSYVETQLVESHDYRLIANAHADYFNQLAQDSVEALRGPQQAAYLARLTAEHPNVRAALTWCLDHERYDQAAQMTGALSRFWYMRGHLREGRQWVELALKQVIGVSPENRAAALHGAGMLTFSQGDLTAAEAYYQDAIKLRRLTGDMRGVALLLNNLGLVLWKRGQIKQAHAMFLESAELLRPIGDENGVANALINLGIMAFEQGEWEQSAAYNIEALAFRRKINNPHAIAICLNNLGATTTGQGDFVKARELLEEGLSICRSMGFTMLIANIASLLAIVLLEQQQYDEARKLLIESLQIRHELGDVAGMSDSVGKIGILEGRVGNPRQAAQLIAMVLHFREQQGYSLDYLERNWYKAAIDDLQGKLGDTAWNEITAAGRRDDFDTTVAALLEKA